MAVIDIPVKVRSFIYVVGAPLEAVALFYGIGSEQSWSLWIALALAIVTGSTAIINRPTEAGLVAIQSAAINNYIETTGAYDDTALANVPAEAPLEGERPYLGD